jgi:peptidoglycan lytic transglycosylase
VRITSVALVLAAASIPAVAAQTPLRDRERERDVVAVRAESLRQAGRPWHAAELLLAAASRDPNPNARFVVQGATAELGALRYDRARSLLVGRPWLEDYDNGEALAVLGAAEAGLGLYAQAASHFAAARQRGGGAEAALRGVHAGLAWEQAGERDSAATAFAAALDGGLPAIEPWLRLREARVVRDTARAAHLLADLPAPAAHHAPAAWAQALLAAGDSLAALDRFTQAGRSLDAARLALRLGDSARARVALYSLMARAPESDDAAAAVGVALSGLPPCAPPERVALARAMKFHGAPADARAQVELAVQGGDSSAATLLLLGDLLATSRRYREAAHAYRLAAGDSALGPLAIYRRARILARLGDAGAAEALAAFAQSYPTEAAAPTALYVLGDAAADRADWPAAARWFGQLFARYPTDPRSSQGRFRLAAHATGRGLLDSAAALYRAEVAAGGPLQLAARFWLGKVALARADTVAAQTTWVALAHDDSVGYYGLRARRAARLPPLVIAVPPETVAPPAVIAGLGDIDTLVLAGLDSEAQAEVRHVLGHPPAELEALLSWSEGLAARGWGPAAVRLAWLAALKSPNDPRVLRAIFPWPNRSAVEAEAKEFGIDPLLLVAIVRQESVFDPEALSPAGARGLAQLLPGTAAFTARGLDVSFDTEWITVPDLNLHLGAAHFAKLLRRFGGRVEPAVAAYNAGAVSVVRWLARPGADDPDRFIELIPYEETRGYVRSVLRNQALYRAMYGPPS